MNADQKAQRKEETRAKAIKDFEKAIIGIKDAKILISETEDAIKNKPRDVRWRYNSRYYGREWQMRYANPPIGDVVKRELEEEQLKLKEAKETLQAETRAQNKALEDLRRVDPEYARELERQLLQAKSHAQSRASWDGLKVDPEYAKELERLLLEVRQQAQVCPRGKARQQELERRRKKEEEEKSRPVYIPYFPMTRWP